MWKLSLCCKAQIVMHRMQLVQLVDLVLMLLLCGDSLVMLVLFLEKSCMSLSHKIILTHLIASLCRCSLLSFVWLLMSTTHYILRCWVMSATAHILSLMSLGGSLCSLTLGSSLRLLSRLSTMLACRYWLHHVLLLNVGDLLLILAYHRIETLRDMATFLR